MSDDGDTVTLYGTKYEVSEGTITIQHTISQTQAEQVQEQASEAVNLQEGIRMLTQHAIEIRRSRLQPEDIQQASEEIQAEIDAIREYLEDGTVQTRLEEMDADLRDGALGK